MLTKRLDEFDTLDEFFEYCCQEKWENTYKISLKHYQSALIYIGSWLTILVILCISLIVGCEQARAEPITLIASWYSLQSLKDEGTFKYSKGVQANGKFFDENAFTCASNDFPLGARLKITTIENPKKSVIVENTDRTNKRFKGKRIDLTPVAFKVISDKRGLEAGLLKVRVEKI